jgi:hypothetical protein
MARPLDQPDLPHIALRSFQTKLLIGPLAKAIPFSLRTVRSGVIAATQLYTEEASMYEYSYIQWKVAMARMHEANMAATEITEQGEPTRPTSREIAEFALDCYFKMIEAELNHRPKLYACEQGQIAAKNGKHIQACPFDTGTSEWRGWREGFCDARKTNSCSPDGPGTANG